MNYKFFMCVTLSTVALLGCSKTNPLLENREDFIGQWKNDSTTLKIAKDGDVEFSQHIKSEAKIASQDIKASSVSDIKAPITQFTVNHFTIGDGKLSKEFAIDRAPFKQDGKWHIILNSQIYTKY